MRANPYTRDVQFDWNEQKKSIRLEVDQDRARSLGLTPQDIAQTLGTLLSGYTVTEYREGIDLVPVVARAIPRSASASARSRISHPDALGCGRADLAGRARSLRVRGAYSLAAQSRCGADRALRHRRGQAGAGRDGADPACDRCHRGHAAARHAHRGRRRGGGERQGQRRPVQDIPAHVPRHADHPDAAAQQLLATVPRILHRAAGGSSAPASHCSSSMRRSASTRCSGSSRWPA